MSETVSFGRMQVILNIGHTVNTHLFWPMDRCTRFTVCPSLSYVLFARQTAKRIKYGIAMDTLRVVHTDSSGVGKEKQTKNMKKKKVSMEAECRSTVSRVMCLSMSMSICALNL